MSLGGDHVLFKDGDAHLTSFPARSDKSQSRSAIEYEEDMSLQPSRLTQDPILHHSDGNTVVLVISIPSWPRERFEFYMSARTEGGLL